MKIRLACKVGEAYGVESTFVVAEERPCNRTITVSRVNGCYEEGKHYLEFPYLVWLLRVAKYEGHYRFDGYSMLFFRQAPLTLKGGLCLSFINEAGCWGDLEPEEKKYKTLEECVKQTIGLFWNSSFSHEICLSATEACSISSYKEWARRTKILPPGFMLEEPLKQYSTLADVLRAQGLVVKNLELK